MKRRHRLILWALVVVLATALVRQPASAAPEKYTTYIVQPGDTLTRIAARYGVTTGQLAAANGLRWNAWVYTGQRLVIPSNATPRYVSPSGSHIHVVKRGETLARIAAHYGVTTRELAALNGLRWNSWVYVGQRLAIPGNQSSQVPSPAPVPSGGDQYYVVKAGNTLFSIARWYGTTVSALRTANGLRSNTIYVGQRLRIPGRSASPKPAPTSPQPATPSPSPGARGEKWIDVDLTKQRVTAYEGQTPVYSALASTGIWRYPTVVGTFRIYVKYRYTPMSGPGYYLPNVPHTMYFYRGYAIHGAYWHHNFGTPMSHGCVNLSLTDAAWFYNWAPVGTKVVTHY